MSWNDLETADPGLAAFGVERFGRTGVAYRATVRADGAPRVHPVTPIIGEERLFLFMEPSSPKSHDLQRDNRYTMHAAVVDQHLGAAADAANAPETLAILQQIFAAVNKDAAVYGCSPAACLPPLLLAAAHVGRGRSGRALRGYTSVCYDPSEPMPSWA